jgi:hypothetical protein
MPNNDQITITVAAFALTLWLAPYVRRQYRASRQRPSAERIAGDYYYRAGTGGVEAGALARGRK